MSIDLDAIRARAELAVTPSDVPPHRTFVVALGNDVLALLAERDQLLAPVEALLAERKAWRRVCEVTADENTSSADCALACRECDAAAEVLDAAVAAYLAAHPERQP